MKEKLEKVKEFVDEHSLELGLAIMFGLGCTTGFIIGQWSMIPMYEQTVGVGAQGAIEFARVNGLEAAEKIVKEAYKIK